MNDDPLRLRDMGTHEERQLIAGARAEHPPSGAVARALSTLGVAGAVALAPTAAAAGLASGAAKGSTFTLVSLAKWLAIGVLSGTLTTVVATVTTSSTSTGPARSVVPPRSSIDPTRSGPAPTPRKVELRNGREPISPPAAEPSAVSPERDRLREELTLLDRARRALAEGRAGEARALLGRHRERFQTAALAEEAAVLRIEVALAHGESDLGEQAARDFLQAHPSSPHAPRVRSLLFRVKRDPKAVEWPSSP